MQPDFHHGLLNVGYAGHALPFAGALQLPDFSDDEIALDAAQPIDEERAIEMVHFVLERPRQQPLALLLLLVTAPIEAL